MGSSGTDELRKLLIENPELKILPFVSEDCNGDYPWQLTSIRNSMVDEYVVSPYDPERVILRSGGYEYPFGDEYKRHCEVSEGKIPNEFEVEEAFNSLDWEKAIIVYIKSF